MEDGSGIVSWTKNLISTIRDPKSALHSAPKAVLEAIEKYAAYNITSITVHREPLSSGVAKFVDLISSGNFSKQMAKANYDKMYHLYAILHLDNGVKLLTERNERVKLAVWNGKLKNNESITIKTNVRVGSLFNTAIDREGADIWRYDPIYNNCQKYISSLLKYHNYLTPAANTFINQDVTTLLTKGQQKVAKNITDFASLAKNVISGGKLELGRFGQITRY
jgi:hypothetical protein